LIMDEPTSVLTPQEVAVLFQTLEKLRGEGRSILYISHKLEEIRALCDTATILRLGKKVAVGPLQVRLAGEPVGDKGPNARRALGLLAAPEERLGHAAAPDMSLMENALLTGERRKDLSRKGMINWGSTRSFAKDIIAKFDVRTPSETTAARALSGGNLQKFVIGREILQSPQVLVVNQPTWGVDASAAAAIRQALLDLASEGAAIVVISQDLDELMEVADRF